MKNFLKIATDSKKILYYTTGLLFSEFNKIRVNKTKVGAVKELKRRIKGEITETIPDIQKA